MKKIRTHSNHTRTASLTLSVACVHEAISCARIVLIIDPATARPFVTLIGVVASRPMTEIASVITSASLVAILAAAAR